MWRRLTFEDLTRRATRDALRRDFLDSLAEKVGCGVSALETRLANYATGEAHSGIGSVVLMRTHHRDGSLENTALLTALLGPDSVAVDMWYGDPAPIEEDFATIAALTGKAVVMVVDPDGAQPEVVYEKRAPRLVGGEA